MTYHEARKQAAKALSSAGIEQAETESRLLMEYATQTESGFYLLHREDDMSPGEEESYFALIGARCTRIPLQHLTGEQEFMGLKFLVNENVLIPRQDTEVLAERAVSFLTGAEGARVLDLGTGSGCLAVSIKAFCPNAAVCGSDIFSEALQVAEENARRNQTEITWIKSDLFAEIEGQFDLIVSNPPYIPTNVIGTLMPEVRDHDPRAALDGGPDGLDFYRRILAGCGEHLQPGGRLLFEIGQEQGEAVTALMRENGFAEIEVTPDLTGADRVVTGRNKQHV
ncbi:MAG: peptide chain release factor N(5)-glutamine methyltransferase [Lachnospiraceae bacterium]|nr:peptide chain release factor N(5)-glutamine methyltransferase [Lachnospiraceae bacterium]